MSSALPSLPATMGPTGVWVGVESPMGGFVAYQRAGMSLVISGGKIYQGVVSFKYHKVINIIFSP